MSDLDWWEDPNVVSWEGTDEPNLEKLATLLAGHGVKLTEIQTDCESYAIRIEAASGMPHTPAQGPTPWIPSFDTSECPHRPEWSCPVHAECRACECDCNTYIADLEEPDLSLIPAELIVRDPEVCSGRPTMRGTRILAGMIAGHLDAGTTWEELHEWYPSMPVPAAQPGAGATETSRTGSGRGTGEPRLQISTQGIDPGLVQRLMETLGLREPLAERIDGIARPLILREAAASFQVIADAAEADSLHHEFVEGLRFSACLMDSTARDLTDETSGEPR